ncbi:Flavin reductase [hydrothermal vent metagenome]|uniref:Flavin reductase n=1 Tax=hydrothermal vent metagenome TaxID=652676 RepID=A0A3B0XZE2_9ZZZZ
MKLTIFGATGTIGQHLVRQALSDGHQVTAFSSTASSLALNHQNLIPFTGDVFDPQSVTQAIEGSDAVLITLGSRKLSGDVRSTGTRHIVQAMQQVQVKRLICQSTLGIGSSYANLNFFWKTVMFGLILRAVFKDHGAQEDIVKHSNLDWTIVRPAAFTDETMKKEYKSGFLPSEQNLTLKISRQDVARFMLLQLSSSTYLKQTPGLSY